MAKTTYTSIFSITVDLSLYVAIVKGQAISLSMLPSLAKTRYSWIVANWKNLYKKFKGMANGDQDLEAALADFDSSIKSSLLGNTANILDNSTKFRLYSPFLQSLTLDTIGLTPAEQTLVNQEQQRVGKLSIEDFRAIKKFLDESSALAASALGLGDAQAFKLTGTSTVSRVKQPTISDLSDIDDIIELSKFVDGIIFALRQTTDKPPNLLAIANQNISVDSSVVIRDIYSSYVAVPFEISLEHMALKFLGDRSLWFELVTVNNLQPPYIDEMGQKYSLSAPGASNNVLISANRRADVHVGARVMIGSLTIREESRIIEKILYNSDNSMVLFLSGNQDLFKLQTKEGAFVRIFSPHTVNSTTFILIPLEITSPVGRSLTPQNDSLRRIDQSLLNFGVDIAQNEQTGDMLVDSNGNFVMAYGLKNVRQAVSNVLKTIRGELPFHTQYGLDIDIGRRFFGSFNEATVIAQAISKSVLRDPRFTSANVTSVQTTTTSISINMTVTITGSTQVIPLSFIS